MRWQASRGSKHRWYLLHFAGLCFARAVRLLPRRHRFNVALVMARVALPFIRMTQAYQEQRRGNVDGAYEIALHFILNALTKNEIEFDPVITVHGYEELLSALAYDKGVLAISPHTVLSLLMPRFFRDAGHDPVV